MAKVLLIIHDNNSFLHYFPLGAAYLASVLKKAGHDIDIYCQAIKHYPDRNITDYIDAGSYDFVGVGTISGYYPYRKLLSISEAINKCESRKRFKYVIGGHMPSAAPEYFLQKTGADYCIKGEGEKAFLDIVKGCKEKIVEREPIKDLDSIPEPAYGIFPMGYYRLQRLPNIQPTEFSMSMITGRGCSFNCTFCYRMTKGIRLRSIESIVNEIKYLKGMWGITYIDFADDLTMSSKDRAADLCEAFLDNKLNIHWRCEGRLNFVDRSVLTLMKKAGCVFINYGIESLDNSVLKNMKKGLTKEIIIPAIETTKAVGISPGLNIIWGNIGDTEETLWESVDFLKKYDDFSQIRTISPVTPYPGCELFEEAKRRGLLKDVEDFYEHKYVNSDLPTVNFTNVSDTNFCHALYQANRELLWNHYSHKSEEASSTLKKLYIDKDTSFRGWRHT